jgi:hypothetical protein
LIFTSLSISREFLQDYAGGQWPAVRWFGLVLLEKPRDTSRVPFHCAGMSQSLFQMLTGTWLELCTPTFFGQLTELGIDVAGESQLVGFPTQFPSVSMVDWNNGKPNARFWVLKLLHDNFGPGDREVEVATASTSSPNNPYLYSLAFVTREGKKRVLLVNKRDRAFDVSVAGSAGGQVEYVDQTTGFSPPVIAALRTDVIKLTGFSVLS